MAATSKGLAAEYLTLRDGCGLWQRPAVRGVIMTGEDRQRLLNGLVTCEVKSLVPGQGALGFFATVDLDEGVHAQIVCQCEEVAKLDVVQGADAAKPLRQTFNCNMHAEYLANVFSAIRPSASTVPQARYFLAAQMHFFSNTIISTTSSPGSPPPG